MNINVFKVRKFMRDNVREHVDPRTDEVNATALAEACAQAFDYYEDDADATIPEEIFDIAAEYAIEHDNDKRINSMRDKPF